MAPQPHLRMQTETGLIAYFAGSLLPSMQCIGAWEVLCTSTRHPLPQSPSGRQLAHLEDNVRAVERLHLHDTAPGHARVCIHRRPGFRRIFPAAGRL